MIRCCKAGGSCAPAQPTRKGCGEPPRRLPRLELDLSQHMRGLERYAGRAQAELAPDLGHQSADHGMKMEMLVPIAVIEEKTRRAKGLELRSDLGGELEARSRMEEHHR